MSDVRKSLYLLADSQLLFCNHSNSRLLEILRIDLRINDVQTVKAAYLGASNKDNKEYFELFVAAMDNIGSHSSKQIFSEPTNDEINFVKNADLILLGGGEVAKGWNIYHNNSLNKLIMDRFYNGAVIIGVSAGAVQLGMGAYIDSPAGSKDRIFIDTFKLFPHFIDVHDEENDWYQLRQTVRLKGNYSRGFGIPFGAGLVYHQNLTIEPLNKPLIEIDNVSPEKPESETEKWLLPQQ